MLAGQEGQEGLRINLLLMLWGWLQRGIRVGRIIACAALLTACASAIQNDPVNQRLAANPREVEVELGGGVDTNYDDMVVAL